MTPAFWQGKRVCVTGHTGFKGGWLCLWLHQLGAEVSGFSLEPRTTPNLFTAAKIEDRMSASWIGDVRDLDAVKAALARSQPEIVIHMAAQALVRESYVEPVETYATNVMGTVNVLEAARHLDSVRVVLVVTSDKCYENRERSQGYREDEAMGGFDPYSSSKGCAELVTAAYRRSFYSAPGAPAVATARSGNVIGGGDWSKDRLVPDAIAAFMAGKPLRVRDPDAVRPWQHVLDPLSGYLTLVEHLWRDGAGYAGPWNFGPADEDSRPVRWVVEALARRMEVDVRWELDPAPRPHEAGVLRLDCSKAREQLGWKPRLPLATAIERVAEWYRGQARHDNAAELTRDQILRYQRELPQ